MKTVEQRLFDHSKVDPSTGCRLWQRYCDRDGYGLLKQQGKHRRAHRVSYQVFIGPIPEGLCVLHSCHTPACIAPEHLRVGTHKDNADDRDRAGRSSAKLKAADVIEIRSLYSLSNVSQRKLAKQFGVSQRQILRIIQVENWKGVSREEG